MEGDQLLFEPSSGHHRVRRQALRQRSASLFLAFLAIAFLSVTIFFAYNYCSPQPISSKLMFKEPGNSILLLNLLSQMTMFCLTELAFSVLDVLRWAFVSRSSGTSAYTFLALSRATNLAGVLYLIFGKGPMRRGFEGDNHRLWSLQRY